MVRVSHSLQSLRKCVRTHYECVFLVIDTVRSCYDDDFLLLIKAQKWQIKGEKNNNNNKHIEMRMVPHGSNFVIGILLCVPHFNVVFFVRACSADTHTHTLDESTTTRCHGIHIIPDTICWGDLSFRRCCSLSFSPPSNRKYARTLAPRTSNRPFAFTCTSHKHKRNGQWATTSMTKPNPNPIPQRVTLINVLTTID